MENTYSVAQYTLYIVWLLLLIVLFECPQWSIVIQGLISKVTQLENGRLFRGKALRY